MSQVSKDEVMVAQRAWADGLIDIGRVYQEGCDHRARAGLYIETLYAHRLGPVFFKPTMVSAQPFRNNFAGTLSYFVGGDPDYSEDSGFALRPWVSVRFENAGVVCQNRTAHAMGNYFFRDSEGEEIKAEYSFAYVRSASGELLINLHHSSIPFSR